MPYRVAKTFTVESGHMLSRHPERCRHPHGHTRHVEIVVVADELDENGMVVDFKALKRAVGPDIERFDHAMAVNASDPLLPALRELHEDGLIVLDEEPTTEVLARVIYEACAHVLAEGWTDGVHHLPPGRARLDRVRVGETPSSWAEYFLEP